MKQMDEINLVFKMLSIFYMMTSTLSKTLPGESLNFVGFEIILLLIIINLLNLYVK